MEHNFTSSLLCYGGNFGEILVNFFLSLEYQAQLGFRQELYIR